MKHSKFLFLSMLSTVFTGCMVGPNYIPPEPTIEEEWQCSEELSYEEPYSDWWKLFNDPLLNKYIELAYCYNNDVMAAEANIMRASALRQVAAANLFPQISADFNVSRTYFSKNGPLFAASSFSGGINSATGLPFQVQIPQIQNLYNALINFSWQPDFWGKTRRGIEAAEANIQVAAEERNGVLLNALSQIAIDYINIRSLQNLGVLIEESICLLEQNEEIARKRYEAGYSNYLDLEKIEAELLGLYAQLPNIYASIIQNIYALSILTGHLPEAFMEELIPLQCLPKLPSKLMVGIRSDLLRRRPDIRRDERRLAAATANIGVAVASFYPTFTLSGDIGFQSLGLDNLFQAQSKTWSLQGDINAPLFQGGRLCGNLKVSESEAIAAVYTYHQTVLNAIKEAESAIIAYTQQVKTLCLFEEAVEKNRDVVNLTNKQYVKGLITILNVLDAERQLNTAQQNMLNNETQALIDVIQVYKSLGGGWEFCCE